MECRAECFHPLKITSNERITFSEKALNLAHPTTSQPAPIVPPKLAKMGGKPSRTWQPRNICFSPSKKAHHKKKIKKQIYPREFFLDRKGRCCRRRRFCFLSYHIRPRQRHEQHRQRHRPEQRPHLRLPRHPRLYLPQPGLLHPYPVLEYLPPPGFFSMLPHP